MNASNLRPIDQLLEAVRHLHDHSTDLQIEVSIRDTKRPPNGRVYTLTTCIGSDHLSEGSYIPGQGSMFCEGGTVETTADPLAIALQIRDAIYGQGVWHEARAAKAQELLDRDADLVMYVEADFAGSYDRPVVVRGGSKVTCRHCDNGCHVCQPTRDRVKQFQRVAQTMPFGAQEIAAAMGKTSDEFARDCAEAMKE